MGKIVSFTLKIDGVDRAIQNTNELKEAQKQLKREIGSVNIGSKQYTVLATEQAKAKVESDRLRQSQKELQLSLVASGRSALGAKGSYNQLQAEAKLLELEFNRLGNSSRDAIRRDEIAKRSRAVRQEMRQLRDSIGRTGVQGAFERANKSIIQGFTQLKQVLTGGILLGVFTQIGQTITQSVNVFADFSRQIQFLGAVSGATAPELAKLEEQAKQLGATTQFSASQVAQLQIEYSKLGFGPSEILATTADTLNLAAVAQSDLGETAIVVGSTLRQFGLDASETQRVTDVLGKSFSSSALDLQKFSVAIASVGPVAGSVGVSLERTTALLGTLVDRGLDASTAGTSLRNIFLELANRGLTFDEAMQQINDSTDSAVTALDFFGKRGVTAGLILSNTGESVNAFTESLENAAGFTQQAGDTITNDLRGSLDTLKSTIEAAQISFIELFEGGVTLVVEGLTAFIRVITSAIELMKSLPQFIRDNKVQLIALTVALVAFNAEQIRSNALILISNARLAASTAVQKGAAIATGLLRAAQLALNVAMTANPIGLVIAAIGLLVAGIKTAYDSFEGFRAVVDGTFSVVKEFARILKETVGEFVSAFQAFKEGNIREGFKSLGRGIINSNPISIAYNEGKRLGDAYRVGYQESITKPMTEDPEVLAFWEQENRRQFGPFQDALVWAPDAVEAVTGVAEAVNDLEEETEDSLAAVERFAAGSIGALRQQQQELQKQLEGAVGDEAITALATQLAEVDQEIARREARIEAIRAEIAAAEGTGSLAELNATLSAINARIQEATDAAEITELLAQRTVVAQSIDLLESRLDELEARANLDALPEEEREVAIQVEDIEARRDAQIAAILEEETARIDSAERIKAVELEAQQAILQARLSVIERGSAEYLAALRELRAVEAEIEGQSVDAARDALAAQIEAIEVRANRERIAVLENTEDRQEAAELLRDIEIRAQDDILEARIAAAEEGSAELLELLLERLKKEKKKKEETEDEEAARRKEFWETAISEGTAFAAQLSQGLIAQQRQLIDQQESRALAAVEEEYQARIAAAEGNTVLQEKLEQELADKKEAIELKAAERRKQIAITEAIIQTALGVIEAIPDPVRVAAAVFLGAIQLQTIQAAEFAGGGYTGLSSTAAPDRTGHRPAGVVHVGEYVAPRSVVEDPEAAPALRKLERMRLRKGLRSNRLPGFYQDGGLAGSISIPAAAQGTGGGDTLSISVNATPELVAVIAGATQQGVRAGAKEGVTEGLREAGDLQRDQDLLTNRTNF
jgi:hypothetical protein